MHRTLPAVALAAVTLLAGCTGPSPDPAGPSASDAGGSGGGGEVHGDVMAVGGPAVTNTSTAPEDPAQGAS